MLKPSKDLSSQPPAPRTGWRGEFDKFIGPGATSAELILQFGTASIIGLFCFLIYLHHNPDSPWKLNAVVLLLGIDLVGGVVTNSTSAAKRWYHRAGQGFRQHMTFIAIHALQIFLVACLFTDNSLLYFGVVYSLLLLSSVLVLTVPLYLQRPVAMSIVAGFIPFSMSNLVPKTLGLDWFIPLLFLKLLVAHLTFETAFQP